MSKFPKRHRVSQPSKGVDGSHREGSFIDHDKLEKFLLEAGVPRLRSSIVPVPSLTCQVDHALVLSGLTPEELRDIDEAFSKKQKSLTIAAGIGVGMAAMSIAQSAEIIDFFIKAGGCLGDTIVKNIDTLFSEKTFHLLQQGISEIVLDLPGGTIHFAEKLLMFCEHPDRIIESVRLTMEHGESILDALEIVGLGIDVMDLVDAATTLGVSLLVSRSVKWLVDNKYKPILEEKEAHLANQRQKYIEVMKLRYSLKSKLPARIVAIQLGNVDRRHWGF